MEIEILAFAKDLERQAPNLPFPARRIAINIAQQAKILPEVEPDRDGFSHRESLLRHIERQMTMFRERMQEAQ
jgi:hypothetical protein